MQEQVTRRKWLGAPAVSAAGGGLPMLAACGLDGD
jgi:hypothetical protein